MKIAVCLSGAPRFAHRGLFRQIEAMQGFDQADFFIRTRKTKQFGETAEESLRAYFDEVGIPYKQLPIVFQPTRDTNEYQTRQQLVPTYPTY